jgi:hypothetical protein
MKHFIRIILLVAFVSCLNAQVIFKPQGQHVHPKNPNGTLINQGGPSSKPKPVQQAIHYHNGSYAKPNAVTIARPKPHHHHDHNGPYSNNCSNSIWVPGHWYYNTEIHKKIWVDGYAILTMDGGVYISGHWIETAHGLYWLPGHWLNRGYPIYK